MYWEKERDVVVMGCRMKQRRKRRHSRVEGELNFKRNAVGSRQSAM